MSNEKLIVLLIFIACYTLALSRKVKIAYASLGASALLLAFGILSFEDAFYKAIKWDVLGIYWGFMMVSFVFMKSRMPELLANKILLKVKKEKYVILSLCAITAFLSAFMENVGVVLMMAPVAIEVAKKFNTSLFYYMISIAISSNVVTTVTMVADPPPIILALETGMKPLDFYWFQGRPGLGTLTIFGVIAALLTLLFQYKKMNKKIVLKPQKIEVKKGASLLFILGVLALFLAPEFGVSVGIVGFTVGLISLYMGRKDIKEMIVEFDWNSFFFIIGVFIVIFSLNSSGVLKDFSELIVGAGFTNPSFVLAIITWISVAFSSFMDNVPYTVLMIPVCQHLAELLEISAWPLLFGMLVGTGTGGNITPVGAAANVFACGILEKHGYKIVLKEYLKIGLPFSVVAVATIHILLQIFWMR
ncbi:MAG: SLC13 family permease [Thermodesulfovibrio sp.]|nr:SLC13 family permease [Thermodesulfovibrio sp.]